MHTLTLLACDSLYASPEMIRQHNLSPAQIPHDMNLMQHQIATLEALRSGGADFVVNTAMTGDGKTLAAQLLPLLDAQSHAMFMYPTNELLRDQERGLFETLNNWPTQPHWPRGERPLIRPMNADRLDEVQMELDLDRPDAARQLLDSDILLTNPDIFHFLMQFRYPRPGAARDHLVGPIADRYRLFVFDEFHLFGAPQAASALIAMLLLREISGGKARFLFLSATPQPLLGEWARQVGLTAYQIDGEYQHGDVMPEDGWRRILRQADLHLWSGNLESWLLEHREDIVKAFFRQHRPGAKGVIIANSIASAHRIHALLEREFKQENLSVGLNTGLTGQEERRVSRETDLIVGTSTIDVGVDFRINLLIFESTNAASHLQRLGRLGRHADDGAGHPFEQFEAHALLPEWVISRIAEQIPDHSVTARPAYFQAVEEAFPAQNTFRGYERRWGKYQAGRVLVSLSAKETYTQYKATSEILRDRFSAVFGAGLQKQYAECEQTQRPILDEASSFRGGSPLTALVMNHSRGFQVVLPYSLTTLLRHGDLEPLDLDDLLAKHPHLERHKPLTAFRLDGWLPKPRTVQFTLDAKLENWQNDKFGVARVQRGFQIDAPGAPGLSELNKRLKRHELVATLVCGMKPPELYRKLRIGIEVELYGFTTLDNLEGSVAFGRGALLLDTALSRNRHIDPSCGGSLIF